MTKLAIIGASHFQDPLICKAKEMGIETHVFAWAADDVGEKSADFFYPISITDKDAILEKCREIGVDGVATIGTDLGNIAVAHVANGLGLVANSMECVSNSTNKELMRSVFEAHGDPSPWSVKCTANSLPKIDGREFPVIVKPSDRSGSRGIAKVDDPSNLRNAIEAAAEESFSGVVLVEEFVDGAEFSIECISWEGRHEMLAITEKFTTGAPRFIEKGHLEPARISHEDYARIKRVVLHALDSLGVRYGASHSEVKLTSSGAIKIIEIGSRMGGDCIGSHLVELSTGFDFVGAVVDIALGHTPDFHRPRSSRCAAVRFVFSSEDVESLERLKRNDPGCLVYESPIETVEREIVDSSTRLGYYIMASEELSQIEAYLPEHSPGG